MIVYTSGLLMESCPWAGQTPVGRIRICDLDVNGRYVVIPALKIVSRVEGEMFQLVKGYDFRRARIGKPWVSLACQVLPSVAQFS
jgi:hypothetical protein